MPEQEKDPTLLTEYLGEGSAPDLWSERLNTLRMHSMRIKDNKYSSEAGEILYHNSIAEIRRLCNEFSAVRAQKLKTDISKYYPNWKDYHFKQLLIQLGELE